MRLIFAGTPPFAAVALEALIAAGHDIALVLSQPDRPRGRGLKLSPCAVAELAGRHGLPLHQPERLKDPATHAPIREANADVMVVAAYGLILPQAVLDIPRLGCLNIHGSLLPRWRGAAPVQRAILAGDEVTGVGIMQMEAGLDTIRIADEDTSATLTQKLAVLGGQAIVEALGKLPQLTPQPQPEAGLTYAHKIEKRESAIDFRLSATHIARQIRAFDPFPGSEATWLSADGAAPLKFWQARVLDQQGAPGVVLAADSEGIVVATGGGALQVTVLQAPGGRRLTAREFLAGHDLAPGHAFRVD
jgi:methionyl-tRNA formyltransferase